MSDEQYTPSVDEVRDWLTKGDPHAEAEYDRMIADVARRAKAEALREFAEKFRPGDGNPWALHVRARARRRADRIETEETP